ncbi:TOM1-like protein 6 isoform X2 [Punica granatum]|uniref:TOM1-like protein 6 isoform X2 n=1 Tax=Punica granatum TaxID=22663 RepID=A0A6P8DXH3_PUNGR|nr:TOM1-like protein 6 isoform X2 [Punica granatum]
MRFRQHLSRARDVLKAVKKRLQHKNPRVQFLALTLLEAMVNNCGDYIHFQIVERNILEEMVKIVKKKREMSVQDKTLSLLDIWQEAFGGQGGKYPQYYYAYDELRRSGVTFPRRLSPVAPIFTPPVAHPIAHAQGGYGMPTNSSRRLDEAMAADKDRLSASTLESMQNIVELLSDMLQAMNPGDAAAVKDDIVVDLIDRCRANQKKLMQMLTTTEDEELLGRGLELLDVMQNSLAKHDAIANGSVVPSQATDIASESTVSSQSTSLSPPAAEKRSQPSETKRDISPRTNVSPQSPAATFSRGFVDEEEEDDDFAQLARRHSRSPASPGTFTGSVMSPTSTETADQIRIPTPDAPTTATSKALVLTDLPPPVRTTKEQDMIDLLSLALTTTSVSSQDPPSTPPSNQSVHTIPNSSNGQANPYSSQPNFDIPGQAAYSSYIAPWAQQQMQPRALPLEQTRMQPQYPQNNYGYPPPPWASSLSSLDNQQSLPMSARPFGFAGGQGSSQTSIEGGRPFPNINPPLVNNRTSVTAGPASAPSSTGQKPYVPSYRLFEDLNVLGNGDKGNKTGNGTSTSSLSGISGQNRVGGWR